MWRDIIELGTTTETFVHGEPVQSITYRTVYANKKSVKRSEFYQAAATGLKPELVFEVHTFELSNDKKVRYNGKEYAIIRTYEIGDTTELTITSFVGTVV